MHMNVFQVAVALSLVVTSTLGFVSTSYAADKKAKVDFKELNITSPYEITHPIMAADILPQEGTELLTFTVDEANNRKMLVYGYNVKDKSYAIIDELLIDKSYFTFDLSEPEEGRKQHLYFMSSTQLVEYKGKEKSAFDKLIPIATVNSIFLKDSPQFITRGDFIKDLNQDELDDFLIPDFNGVHLYLGQKEGTPIKQSLPIKPQVRIFDDGARYTTTPLFISDVNFDKQFDIVQVGEGEMYVYLQNEAGEYESTPHVMPIKSSISGTNWWDKRDNTGESLDQSNLKYHKLEELRDVDNDGVTDMVVRYTQSSGVLDKTNDYEVYLGKNNKGKLEFSDEPNSVIKADGTLTGLEFVDIDNDDKYEVLLSGFDIGLAQIIGALLAGSIDQNVFLFKIDSNGNYSPKPNVSREVELNFSLTKGQSGSAVVKLADVNGDNLKDMVLSKGDDRLKIYLGKKGDKAFSKRSITYKTNLPKDGNKLFVHDLNNDGKDDILMKYSSLDDESLARQFKVLLAQ